MLWAVQPWSESKQWSGSRDPGDTEFCPWQETAAHEKEECKNGAKHPLILLCYSLLLGDSPS